MKNTGSAKKSKLQKKGFAIFQKLLLSTILLTIYILVIAISYQTVAMAARDAAVVGRGQKVTIPGTVTDTSDIVEYKSTTTALLVLHWPGDYVDQARTDTFELTLTGQDFRGEVFLGIHIEPLTLLKAHRFTLYGLVRESFYEGQQQTMDDTATAIINEAPMPEYPTVADLGWPYTPNPFPPDIMTYTYEGSDNMGGGWIDASFLTLVPSSSFDTAAAAWDIKAPWGNEARFNGETIYLPLDVTVTYTKNGTQVPEIPAGLLIPLLGLIGTAMIWLRRKK